MSFFSEAKNSITKKSAILGAIPALLIIGAIIYKAKAIWEFETYGPAMFISCILAAILTWCGIAIKPNIKSNYYWAYVAVIFFLAPMINVMCVERMNGNFFLKLWHLCWIDNYSVALLVYLLLFAISGSVRISTLIGTPFFFLFGLANMYVKEFKGGPLVPMDVGSIATATTVAGDFTYDMGAEAIFAASFSIMVMALACRLKMPKIKRKRKVAGRVASLLVVLVMAGVFYGTDVLVNLGYKPDFFNQTRGYERYGAILGFTENTRYLRLSKPADYEPEKLEEEVKKVIGDGREVPLIFEENNGKSKTADSKNAKNNNDISSKKQILTDNKTKGSANDNNPKTPDVIVIMDEAFSDLGAIGDFKTNEDPMPFMNKMKKESLQGYNYVSVLGSGTSNTEFEFLTGDTMAFLPPGSNAYQLYVNDKQPGLTSMLKDQGYSAETMHPYYKGNWNRPKVYKYMGFDKYRAIEDIFSDESYKMYRSDVGLYYSLREQLKKELGDPNVLLRKYVSDEFDFKEVIRMYEDRDKDKPYYMFNVTMQNHSPYKLYLDEEDEVIKLEGLKGKYPLTEQYLSIIKKTDEALEQLITYFKNVDRPTVILFFGDHQPFIEKGFYKEVMGEWMSDLSDEEKMKCYASRFMLWANFDIPKGWAGGVSTNYLRTLMLQSAGMKLTDYDKYLAHLYKEYPIVTAMGGFDKDNKFFEIKEDGTVSYPGEEGKEKDKGLNLYHQLIYNNMTDEKTRIKKLFKL